MFINNKEFKRPKVNCNYVDYLMDRLSKEKKHLNLYGINLKHNYLYKNHMFTDEKYYGCVHFAEDTRIIECIKVSFHPNEDGRLYSVNLYCLCNVLNEICKQTNHTFKSNKFLGRLLKSKVDMSPLVKTVLYDFYMGNHMIYKQYCFNEEGMFLILGGEVQPVEENEFVLNRHAILEQIILHKPKRYAF